MHVFKLQSNALDILSTLILLSHVKRCWDHAVSNGFNNLLTYAQQVRYVRSETENNVERSWESVSNGFNISRTKEMLRRCWDKVFKTSMSQHLSTLSRGVVKWPQHRLSTNVEMNFRHILRRLTGAFFTFTSD